jgi:hypothetical protein
LATWITGPSAPRYRIAFSHRVVSSSAPWYHIANDPAHRDTGGLWRGSDKGPAIRRTWAPWCDGFTKPKSGAYPVSDETKQKTVRVVTGVKQGFQKNKLTIQSSSLVFDGEGKLIEVKRNGEETVEIAAVAH